jgi:hypothetical protein
MKKKIESPHIFLGAKDSKFSYCIHCHARDDNSNTEQCKIRTTIQESRCVHLIPIEECWHCQIDILKERVTYLEFEILKLTGK